MPRPTFILFLLSCLVVGAVPASAQTNARGGSSGSSRASAWTGSITYTRTQSMSDSTTTERVSGRGTDTRNWEMKYNYKATVGVVEAPAKKGRSAGKANITHTFSSKETRVAVERNSCDQGKTWRDMTGTFTSETIESGQGTVDANVHIGINRDGTYSVSVATPSIDGQISGSETSSFSGQCTPKEGKNLTMEPRPSSIDGNSLRSDGSHRLNPEDPNRLSGSYTQSFADVVETITWSLQKDGGPLRLTELTFEDMKYPTWDSWQQINEQTGTVDGNWVKIRATVLNASGETKSAEVRLKETYKGDKWEGARPDAALKDATFSVTLEPGEAREVEMIWDSSGYAWYDDGRPRLVQRLKAELWESSTKADEMTKNLKIRPRPIVLVGGVTTGEHGFEVYQNLLTTEHSYDWKAAVVVGTAGHGTIHQEGAMQQIESNPSSVYAKADNLATYVDGIRRSINAWHVDMLGHSTGGLAARLYVHKQMDVLPDGLPVVKHLMLVGTPNNGIPCPGSLDDDDASSDAQQAAKELTPEEMGRFNQYVTQRKGTKFSALVGNASPVLCLRPQWNDGFVPETSASHGIEDVTKTNASHEDLLNTENFGGYVRAHIITGPQGTYPYAKK